MRLFNLMTLNRALCLLLLLISGVCQAGNGFTRRDAIKICKMPEHPIPFMELVAGTNKGKIAADDLKPLMRHFQVEKDEQIIYPAYSESEKVRFVVLSKACTASDGVDYHFYIASFTDLTGNAVFSQYYLVYQYADILDEGKRISFRSAFLTDIVSTGYLNYGKLTVQRRVGLSVPSHLDDYMKNSSCSTLTDENISSDRHPHKLLILASTPVSYCLDPDVGTKEPLKDAVICDPGNFPIFLSRFLESEELQRKHIKLPIRYQYVSQCADMSGMDVKRFEEFQKNSPESCLDLTIVSAKVSATVKKMLDIDQVDFPVMWNQHTLKKHSWLLSIFVSDSEAIVHTYKPDTDGQALYFFEHTDCWRLSKIDSQSL